MQIAELCKSEASSTSLAIKVKLCGYMVKKILFLVRIMELWEKVKKYESLHIVFWLIKDSCWMLQLKWLGIVMAIPTIAIAIFIVYISRKITDIYLNFAILFWICANSFWMYIEFFTSGQLKFWASIPFGLGFVFVAIYYYKTLSGKQIKA